MMAIKFLENISSLMSRVYADNSQAIGNTPLVRLNHVTKGCKATVLAKVEGRNPRLQREVQNRRQHDLGR